MPDSTTFTPAQKAALREKFAREDYDHKLECYARQIERLFEQGDEEEFGRRVRASRRNGGKVFQKLYANAKRYATVKQPERMKHRLPGLYNALIYAMNKEKNPIALARAHMEPEKRKARTPEQRNARRRQMRRLRRGANRQRLSMEQLRERGYRYAGSGLGCHVHEKPGASDNGWLNLRVDIPERKRKASFWLGWSVVEQRWSRSPDWFTLSQHEPETLAWLTELMFERWSAVA